MASLITTLITLSAGALLGTVPTYLLERSKQRALLFTRWDDKLFQLCAEFAGTTRQLIHVTQTSGNAEDPTTSTTTADSLHRHLRSLQEQIRLIGNAEVQVYARLVQRHMYWIRTVAEGGADEQAVNYQGMAPTERAMAELQRFYMAVRRQLRVTDPDELGSDNPAPIPFDTTIEHLDVERNDPRPDQRFGLARSLSQRILPTQRRR